MANMVIVASKNDLRYVKNHIIFPHKNPFIKVIKHPDLSHVLNVPPKFWKLDHSMIVEMEPAEKEEKLKLLTDKKSYKENMAVLYPWWMKLFSLTLISGLCYLFFHYNK